MWIGAEYVIEYQTEPIELFTEYVIEYQTEPIELFTEYVIKYVKNLYDYQAQPMHIQKDWR